MEEIYNPTPTPIPLEIERPFIPEDKEKE